MPSFRIVFMGTADLACPTLKALLEDPRFEVVAVVTQPDKPKGRDLKLQESEVKLWALKSGVEILQPRRARDPQFIQQLRDLRPDVIVVVAYGQILPKEILQLPKHGCLNVHTSILPKYRGAGPIQWAILNDEGETGVTIMKMDEGLDTGDIVAVKKTPISPADNAQSLHNRLAEMGANLMAKTLPKFIEGQIIPQPQPKEGSSYARKITKEDGRLNWTLPARTLWNQVRAFTPWPGSFTTLQLPKKTMTVKILEADVLEDPSPGPGRIVKADDSGIIAGCGTGCLRILGLQREGGKKLRVAEFLRGFPLTEECSFISPPASSPQTPG